MVCKSENMSWKHVSFRFIPRYMYNKALLMKKKFLIRSVFTMYTSKKIRRSPIRTSFQTIIIAWILFQNKPIIKWMVFFVKKKCCSKDWDPKSDSFIGQYAMSENTNFNWILSALSALCTL